MALMRYQLRLGEQESLDGLVRRLSARVVCALDFSREERLLDPRLHEAIYASLHRAVGQHVRTYRRCGCSSVCDEGLMSSPWVLPQRPADAGQPVKRLILELAGGLDEFERTLEAAIEAAVCRVMEGNLWSIQKVKPALDHAIRSTFGPHLYESFVCGNAPVCAGREIVDPWNSSAI